MKQIQARTLALGCLAFALVACGGEAPETGQSAEEPTAAVESTPPTEPGGDAAPVESVTPAEIEPEQAEVESPPDAPREPPRTATPSPTPAPKPQVAPQAADAPTPEPAATASPAIVDPGGVVAVAAPKPGLEPIGAEKCKVCHKVQYNSWLETAHATRQPPLDCEGCHGPGSEYKKLSVMKDPEQSRAAGLVDPDREFCATCHKSGWTDDMMQRTHDHKTEES